MTSSPIGESSGSIALRANPRSGYDIVKDSVHGYIRFTKPQAGPLEEKTEKDLLDSPWVQRLRRVHQLQGAWYVYPSADHARFVHSLGVMELAGRFSRAVYEPYYRNHPKKDVLPSPALVTETLRVAGLLHDVGHGPFSHLLDEGFFKPSCGGLTHEKIGAWIIRERLGSTIRGIRRTPDGDSLCAGETIDPNIVAGLVDSKSQEDLPAVWRPLGQIISGAYDADKMDFVLRDGSACGIEGVPAHEVERLMFTSFLADMDDGHPVMFLDESSQTPLWLFLRQRQHLTEAVYYHRTVRSLEHSVEKAVVWAVERLVGTNPRDDAFLSCDESMVHAILCRNEGGADCKEFSAMWNNAFLRRAPWKLAFDVMRVKDRLAPVDTPKEEQIHDIVVASLKGQLPGDAIWVDIRISNAPGEVALLNLHNRTTNRRHTPTIEELITNGVFRHRLFFRVYVHENYILQRDAVTRAAKSAFGEELSDDTSW